MSGTFRLRTARDLFAKLRREQEALRRNPGNSDAAFNFFVTAYHLLEWLYPGPQNKATRAKLRKDPLISTLADIANGAKHFELRTPSPRVKKTSGPPSWAQIPFRVNPGARPVNANALYVFFRGDAAKLYGAYRLASDLADDVVAFWTPLVK